MVVHLRHRWYLIVSMLALGAWLVVRDDASGGALVIAAVMLLGAVAAFRIRIVADTVGLTVVNLGWPRRIRWTEVSGLRVQPDGKWWSMGDDSLEIRLKDGRRVRARALATSTATGYSGWAADKIVGELRRRLAEANGETTDEAEARALEEALRAAETGNYAPFWELAYDDRIRPETLWGRVDELAAHGRVDLDALDRSGPRVSRSVRRYMARRYPEIAAELDEDGR